MVLSVVLLSRILGFLREWMVARQIGSGVPTDTYYAAFTLPDFLNYLVASSALEVVLVPIFRVYIAQDREHEAWHVFSTVVTFTTVVLSVLIAVSAIFAQHLVAAIVPGFSPAEMARVVSLTRIMLPAQLFLCLGVIFASAQVARGNFLVPCLGAAVTNCGTVLGGWFLAPQIGPTGFAVGVLIGSFCGFFVLQIVGLKRVGATFKPNLDFRHPGFRMFLRLAVPFMLALSVVVTDDWMLRWFGSFLRPASITWLAYAKMLARIPMSTIGYAVGLASFPHMAQLYSEGKNDELNGTINQAARTLLLLLFPISALTLALHTPIVYLLFSHTHLLRPDLDATASTLALFSIGIVGFGIQGLLARAFYATGDTITPAIVGTGFTFASVPVYWYCSRHWAHLGLAAASSFVVSVFAVAMFGLLARRTGNSERWALGRFALKLALASALSGAACFRLVRWIEPRLNWTNSANNLLILAGVSAFGFGLYALLATLLKIREFARYLETLGSWLRPGSGERAPCEEISAVLRGE